MWHKNLEISRFCLPCIYHILLFWSFVQTADKNKIRGGPLDFWGGGGGVGRIWKKISYRLRNKKKNIFTWKVRKKIYRAGMVRLKNLASWRFCLLSCLHFHVTAQCCPTSVWTLKCNQNVKPKIANDLGQSSCPSSWRHSWPPVSPQHGQIFLFNGRMP